MRAYGLIPPTPVPLPMAMLVPMAVLVAACTADLEAPYNYDPSSTSGGDALALRCGELPQAAVGAAFAHTLEVDGGEGPYTFGGSVPEGLTLDASTGTISGTPTTAGTVDFDLTVSDTADGSGSATCTLEVNERIAIDLALDATPYCLSGGDTLLDHIAEGTGDGSPITCAHTPGSGNGTVPAGITIDAETCAVSGTLADPNGPDCALPGDPCSPGFACDAGVCQPRLGTWAFVIRGTQSGAEVFVPHCISNADVPGDNYPIAMAHSGAAGQSLVPISRTFDPDAAVAVGSDGDPLVQVTDNGDCPGGGCNFSFQFFINASPFQLDDEAGMGKPVIVDDVLGDDGTNDTLSHGLRLSTNAPVADSFKTRPWVANLDLDYCFATDLAACDTALDPTFNGFFALSVIMVPDSP